MKPHRIALLAALVGVALTQACSDSSGDIAAPEPTPTPVAVVQLNGDVATQLPAFAASIGDVNNGGEPGFHPSGRRQINWDGVPAQFTNTLDFPADFFKVRGAVYGGTTGLRVSDNNFVDINPTYAAEFAALSTPKLFAPVGTNQVEVLFRIPGSDTVAAVRSFGAVVVDVDRPDASRLKAYDKDNRLLADIAVPVRAAGTPFSLAGVSFADPIITRVVISLGEVPLGAQINDVSGGGAGDVVVLDDFAYSEPQRLE